MNTKPAKSAATRIRTTMIGSIGAFEDIFGPLCGLGKPRSEMNQSEIYYDGLREEFRTRVLNLGNGQIRALETEGRN